MTGDGIRLVLQDICREAGLDPTGAEMIKFTNNAVFRLARAPVVVRIAGSGPVSERIQKVIDVSRWLAEHGIPAVRLLDRPQPIVAAGRSATLWHWVPPVGPAPTGRDLGLILRMFHHLPAPAFALPRWDPVSTVRRRLVDSAYLSDGEREFLEDKCAELEQALAEMDFVLPPGPIHGDGFIGNLIPGPRGPVICDFDSTANGPREWDLTPVAVGRLRFAYRGDPHGQVAEAYGTDVTTWKGFPVLRAVRELQLTTSVIPVLGDNPSLLEQWRHRLNSFRRGDQTTLWQPYV